jgi:DNA-binding GntR family transcriptional regulator
MVTTEMSLTQRCVDAIVDQIRTQKLKAGQRLGEVAMARRLKMGRAPVRAAFDQLARAGLLERIARSGTFIRKVSLEEYCELMDLRAALESMAARLAAARMPEAEFDKLAQLARRVDERSARFLAADASGKAEGDSRRETMDLERQFHRNIAAASGNRKIAELLEAQQLLENCFVLGQSFPPRLGHAGAMRRGSRTIPSHAEVVKALRSRDGEAAARAMLGHLLLSKEDLVAGAIGMR